MRTDRDHPLPRVWLLDLADPRWDLDAVSAWLSAAERARAERAVPPVRRRRVLLRAGLRQVAGRLLGQEPGDVEIGDDRGRPVLAVGGLEASCSAHEDVGLVAVAEGPVGVDVAGVRGEDLAAAVAEGWLAAEEAQALARLPVAQQPAALARCWAQKEAVLKAEGVGLTRAPGGVVTPVADRGSTGSWWLTPVPVPAGHVAALATPASGIRSSAGVPVERLVPAAAG